MSEAPSSAAQTLSRYLSLPALDESFQAEYIWIGGTGQDIRCKTRTLTKYPTKPSDLPEWNYDGSSTKQAIGEDSEVWLRPVKFVRDPFRPTGKNILVLCECLTAATMKPHTVAYSNRYRAQRVFEHERAIAEKPWFGMEQEYTLYNEVSSCKRPLGWPDSYTAFPGPQGPYYCSVGAANAFGRYIAEAHYRCCLYAGLTISGINGEVMPGQWEYQIGPVEGIDAADQMWLSRYMLHRVAEDFGVSVSFAPKPVLGDWNGAGMHTNYSTLSMRQDGGYDVIVEAIERLGTKHQEHLAVYGEGNEKRLTGKHETASMETFSYGVAHRGASVRIPRMTEKDGKGYFEDRRPAANCDPYLVTSMIAKTTLAIEFDESVVEIVSDSLALPEKKIVASPRSEDVKIDDATLTGLAKPTVD